MRTAVVLALSWSGAASAEDFTGLWERAERVSSLAETLEPYLQTCRYEEAYLSRQCAALKERLMYLGTSRTFRYSVSNKAGPGAAKIVGKQVVASACLTCASPADLGDGLTGGGYVVGKKPRAIRRAGKATSFDGIELGRSALDAKDQAAKVGPALVTDFVFRTRNEPRSTVSSQPYVVVDVVGYRVYDRCKGRVYAALPGKGGSVKGVEKTDASCPGHEKPVVKVEENLPKTLTAEQITQVMENAREDVLVCYDRYNVPGYAPAKIVVTGADGRIRSIEISGKFEDTPTAECIETVVKAVSFPRFKEPELTIDWKFYLQE